VPYTHCMHTMSHVHETSRTHHARTASRELPLSSAQS
jgi:hypothetical protein